MAYLFIETAAVTIDVRNFDILYAVGPYKRAVIDETLHNICGNNYIACESKRLNAALNIVL